MAGHAIQQHHPEEVLSCQGCGAGGPQPKMPQ